MPCLARAELLGQRFEGGVALERYATLALKSAKRFGARRPALDVVCAESLIEPLEHWRLGGGDRDIVDERRGAQRGERRAECGTLELIARFRAFGEIGDGRDVDVERIEKAPARRRVGARMRGIAGKERMKRVQAQSAGAGAARCGGKSREVAEIADAPALAALKPIKLEIDAPDAGRVLQRLGQIGMRRRHDQHGDVGAAGQRIAGDLDAVIAKRQRRRQSEPPPLEWPAVDPLCLRHRQIRERDRAFLSRAILHHDAPGGGAGARGIADDVGGPLRRPRAQHRDRLERAPPGRGGERCEALRRFFFARRGKTHGVEEDALGLGRERMTPAPDVVVIGLDAGTGGERVECAHGALLLGRQNSRKDCGSTV
jgi:hypothetical protein